MLSQQIIHDEFMYKIEPEMYLDLSQMHPVPSQYIDPMAENWKFVKGTFEDEDINIEIMKLAETSEVFSFLNDPAEDIYNLNDGTAV